MISEAIGLFVLIFTSLVGIFTLARLLTDQVFHDVPEEDVISILPLKGHEGRIEYLIRGLTAHAQHKIIVADFGMDDETREIVFRLKAEHQNLCVMCENELDDYILSFAKEYESR